MTDLKEWMSLDISNEAGLPVSKLDNETSLDLLNALQKKEGIFENQKELVPPWDHVSRILTSNLPSEDDFGCQLFHGDYLLNIDWKKILIADLISQENHTKINKYLSNNKISLNEKMDFIVDFLKLRKSGSSNVKEILWWEEWYEKLKNIPLFISWTHPNYYAYDPDYNYEKKKTKNLESTVFRVFLWVPGNFTPNHANTAGNVLLYWGTASDNAEILKNRLWRELDLKKIELPRNIDILVDPKHNESFCVDFRGNDNHFDPPCGRIDQNHKSFQFKLENGNACYIHPYTNEEEKFLWKNI